MSQSDATTPDRELTADPRLDPRIAAVLEMAGELAPNVTAPPLGADVQACLDYCSAFETANSSQHDAMLAAMPAFPNVQSYTEVIEGGDGNDIALYIHKPKDQDGDIPCIVHTHGGGMVLMAASDPGFQRWRNSLAATGMVVVGVEFRNGGGRLGNHPFPAGLNDCASAVAWTHERRATLKLSSIVLSGESGGGNLALATALKAKREGWIEYIDGVYAMCPYISGQYATQPAELATLRSNDGYMLDQAMMAALAKVYDPNDEHGANPLAWPLHATPDDLSGLPPHVISVNELDPLQDEGLAYYRKLLAAGVSAVGRTVHGTPHAGDGTFPDITPDIYEETVNSIRGFATRIVA